MENVLYSKGKEINAQKKLSYCDNCERQMSLREVIKDNAIDVFYCADCIKNNESILGKRFK